MLPVQKGEIDNKYNNRRGNPIPYFQQWIDSSDKKTESGNIGLKL